MNIVDLGVMPYSEALAVQLECHERVRQGEEDTLFLVEHPPRDHLRRTYAGRRGEPAPRPGRELAARGVEIVKTESRRQHHLPFSGPARSLSRVPRRASARAGLHGFVRTLEEIVVPLHEPPRSGSRPPAGKAAPAYGSAPASCARSACACATGCPSTRLRAGTTSGNDLSLFSAITLCGLHDAEATSLSRECGDDSLSMQEVKDVCTREFQTLFADPPVAPGQAALQPHLLRYPRPRGRALICTRSATAPSVLEHARMLLTHRPPRSSSSATPAPATVPSATSAAASSTRPTPKSPPAWARQRRPSACAMPW